MLLKKINKMNSILRAKENLQDVDFKQILLDSDLIITQTDIKVIDAKTVNIEYLIIDTANDETLKTRAIGKGQNPEVAQRNAYEYMQKMIFSYEKPTTSKKGPKKKEIEIVKDLEEDIKETSNIVNINDSVINRSQQRKLFAMADHDKIHSIIEPMGYTSIKYIKVSDFAKIIESLENENIEKNISMIENIPNITLNFGKYKGKSLKEIIRDKKYIEYLYKNTNNPNIKNATAKALEAYKA